MLVSAGLDACAVGAGSTAYTFTAWPFIGMTVPCPCFALILFIVSSRTFRLACRQQNMHTQTTNLNMHTYCNEVVWTQLPS
jgi:hypothetical protein